MPEQKASGCPIVDRWGTPLPLEDLYLGGQVFLLCPGPSLKTLDLEALRQPGIMTFGINNVSAIFPTNLWTFGDKPQKFHDSIWLNRGTLKFVPIPKLGDRRLRQKVGKGEFRNLDKSPRDCPGVVGLLRNSEFHIERWLWEETVNWGNSKKHDNGLPTLLNTMFQAVRLCYYLGFRTVYLLGVDFQMTVDEGYAFPERRSEGAVRGNMNAYGNLSWYFAQLRPWFESAGFEVLNVNRNSGLRVFDFVGYNDAVRRAAMAETPIDTYGWYEGFGEEMEDD